MKTWIDPKTSLEWQINPPEPPGAWKGAKNYAESLGDDWRLPTIEELESLLDRSRHDPSIREEVPFQDPLDYWSSITYANDMFYAWCVYFYDGSVSDNYKGEGCYVRCVRGEINFKGLT